MSDERKPFQIKGETAQRLLIEDYMARLPSDQIASLDDLAAVADCLPEHVSSIVHAVNETTSRPGFRLVADRGGYRIATPRECLDESTRGRALKFLRQAGRGKRAANAAGLHPDATMDDRKTAHDAAAAWSEAERVARKHSAGVRPLRPELPKVKRSSEM